MAEDNDKIANASEYLKPIWLNGTWGKIKTYLQAFLFFLQGPFKKRRNKIKKYCLGKQKQKKKKPKTIWVYSFFLFSRCFPPRSPLLKSTLESRTMCLWTALNCHLKITKSNGYVRDPSGDKTLTTFWTETPQRQGYKDLNSDYIFVQEERPKSLLPSTNQSNLRFTVSIFH